MEMNSFRIAKDDDGRRLDRVVRRFLPDLSLSALYKLLRKGLIRVDGKKAAPDFRVSEGSELGIAVSLTVSAQGATPATQTTPEPQAKPGRERPGAAMPPDIILETADLLFVNKSSGIPVHGEGGLDGLVAQSASAGSSLSFRTGPLHRLDRDTTGLVAFSRSLEGARWFSASIADRRFEKYYLGLAEGMVADAGEWRDLSGDGKPMITVARPLCSARDAEGEMTLVLYRIVTGRKHQIRIQSSLRAHPLAGDRRYGSRRRETPFYLHAWQMVFPSVRPEGLPERLTAPLPLRFREKLGASFPENVLAHIEAGELYWEQHEEHQ